MSKKATIAVIAAAALAVLALVWGPRELGGRGPSQPSAPPSEQDPVAAQPTSTIEDGRESIETEAGGAVPVGPVPVGGTVTLSSYEGWPSSIEGVALRLSAPAAQQPKTVEVRDARWSAELDRGRWNLTAQKDGVDLAVVPAAVEITEAAEIPVIIEAQAAVRGRLVDCAGVGIEGVLVGVDGVANARFSTDATGRFVIPADSRSHLVFVDEESLPSGLGPPWWQTGPSGPYLDDAFAGSIGGELIEIVLGATPVVRGTAVDEEGTPLSRATLSMRAKESRLVPAVPNYVVVTDERGTFEQRMAHGQYRALLYPSPGYPRARPEPVPFSIECYEASKELRLVFDLHPGDRSVRGFVHDSRGNPMPMHFGLWERLPQFAIEEQLESLAFRYAAASIRANEAGEWLIEGLPAGQYILARTKSDVPRQDLIYVDDKEYIEISTVNGDASFDWVVNAYQPGRVGGEVTSATKDRAHWLVVRMEVEGSPDRTEWLDADGRFAFDRVPPGDVILTLLSREGDAVVPLKVEYVHVVPGQETVVTL